MTMFSELGPAILKRLHRLSVNTVIILGCKAGDDPASDTRMEE